MVIVLVVLAGSVASSGSGSSGGGWCLKGNYSATTLTTEPESMKYHRKGKS